MISEVRIRGFRGIAEELVLKFARITLLAGRNGLGKTTIFDAIDWCLFGPAWRLGAEPASIRNLYDPQAVPRVGLTVELEGKPICIERTPDKITVDGEELSDRQLIDRLIRDRDLFPPYTRDVAARVRQSAYLPQAEIRQMTSPESSEDRAALFQSLLGVPHAAILRFSIRRVNDRISQRQRRLEEQRDELRERILQLTSSTASAPIADPLREATLAHAAALLKIQAQGVASTSGLLSGCRDGLHKLGTMRADLEGFQAFITYIDENRQKASDEVREIENTIILLESEFSKLEEQLRARSQERERAAQDAQATQLSLEQATKNVEQLTGRITTLREIEEVESLVARQESQRRQLDQSLKGALEVVRQASESHEASRTSLEEEQRLLTKLRAEFEHARRLRTLRQRKNELVVALKQKRDNRFELEQTRGGLQTQLISLRSQYADAESALRNASTRASVRERLATLLSEAGRLADELQISGCPLCGQQYRSPAELKAHVEQAGLQRESEIQQLTIFSQRLAEIRTMLAQVESDFRGATRAHAGAEGEEAKLSGELQSVSSDLTSLESEGIETPNQEALARSEAKIKDLQSALANENAALTRFRSDAANAESALLRAREQFSATQTRLKRLRDDLVASGGVQELNACEKALKLGQELVVTASSKANEKDTKLAGAIDLTRQLSDRLSRTRAALEEARGRLARERQRLISLDQQVSSRASDLSLRPDSDSLMTDLLERSTQIASREKEFGDVIRAIEAVLSVEQFQSAALQIAELRSNELRIQQEIDQVARAQRRFSQLAAAVETRSRLEATRAADQLQDAIQECFASLYPHRHLDHVKVSEGELLLFDADLPGAVQPHLYTSTGQLNVLAISVFIASNLRQRMSLLRFILLDEPVQNLADVHFLAFMALIKRVALSRQIILSTADANVAELFRRQMVSSIWARQPGRYVHYEWLSFDSKRGPEVNILEASLQPLHPRRERIAT